MNKTYLMTNQETVNQYLTKASRWIDVIRNGMWYEDDACIDLRIMEEVEQKEVENYIFSIMYPTILKATHEFINRYKVFELEDDLSNQLALDVFMDFHKFNNPKYSDQVDLNYQFSTFVKIYMKDAVRVTWRKKEGITKRMDDKRRIVKLAIERAEQATCKSEDALSIDEIYVHSKGVSKTKLSKEDIKEVLLNMSAPVPLDAVKSELHPTTEINIRIDPFIAKQLSGYVNNLRPLERFVLLQQLDYCPEYYSRISREQLANEEIFIKLCENDAIGRRHLINIEGTDLKMVEIDFIRAFRDASKERFSKFIKSKKWEYEDLSGKMEPTMYSCWKFS